MLAHAVRREEAARDAHDVLAAPLHHKTRFLRHHGDTRRLEVLRIRVPQERRHILRSEHDRHALLRLGDRELRTVQPLIFLRNGIEINRQPIRELTDGHGDTACSEVVAPLDQAADLRIAEQPLQLALRRRVPLLHLGARGRQRLLRMLLR